MRFESSNRKMEIDIYLPNLNFGIEVQGAQHRREVKGWESLATIQARDEEKRIKSGQFGIQIIEIHDNEWDGSITWFLECIQSYGILPCINYDHFSDRLRSRGLFDESIHPNPANRYGFHEERPQSVRKGWDKIRNPKK